MTEPYYGLIITFLLACWREAKESWLAAKLQKLVSFFRRILRESFFYRWVTCQNQSRPTDSRGGQLYRRLHGLQLKIFHVLRLDKLLAGSMFLKTAFWCALPVILAPLVPTTVLLLLVIAAYFSLVAALGCSREMDLSYHPMNKWVYGFAAVYAFGTVTSVDWKSSLFTGVLTVVFVLFFGVMTAAIQSWKQIRLLLLGMVLAGVGVSLYGVYQFIFGADMAAAWVDSDMFSSIGLRIYSTLENPNVLAEYLLLIIPVSVACTFTAKTKLRRAGYAAATALMALAMIMTYSRGGWLGLIFAAAIFLVLLDGRFIFLGIAGLAVLYFVLPDSIIQRFTSIGNTSDSSTSYRVSIWIGTLKMLKDYWFCGVGPGVEAYNMVYPDYSLSAIVTQHSHNLFLQLLCDSGIFGLLTFVGAVIACVRMLFTAMHQAVDREKKTVLIGLMASLGGFLLQGMTDHSFYNNRVAFLFWAVLGLCACCSRLAVRKEMPDTPNDQRK